MTKAKTDPSHDISSHLAFLVHLLQASAQPQNISAQQPLVQSHPYPCYVPHLTCQGSGARQPASRLQGPNFCPWRGPSGSRIGPEHLEDRPHWEIWLAVTSRDPKDVPRVSQWNPLEIETHSFPPSVHVIPTEWPRLPTWIWRSKRPGRTNAWSRMSARFVAAITTSGESVHKECINWIIKNIKRTPPNTTL